MVSLDNYMPYQRLDITSFVQFLPENRWNTSQFILWIQYYADTSNKQKQYQERKKKHYKPVTSSMQT